MKDCLILVLPAREKTNKLLTVMLSDKPLTSQRRDTLKATPDFAFLRPYGQPEARPELDKGTCLEVSLTEAGQEDHRQIHS